MFKDFRAEHGVKLLVSKRKRVRIGYDIGITFDVCIHAQTIWEVTRVRRAARAYIEHFTI